MSMMELNTSEKMLFALLRASLNKEVAEVSIFQEVTEDDWKECYRLAVRHGVKALAWDGMITLPEEIQPSFDRRLVWTMKVEDYEKKYARYCRTIDEMTAFYAKQGIATVQLKGVGLSTFYPIPSHREGGDIDIYTFSADKSRLTDKEANMLADKLMETQGIPVDVHSYKHSNFYYKGIPIENHKVFLNVKQHPVIAESDRWLKECMNPQTVTLLDGTCRIWIPSPAFNTVFLAFHTLSHYGSGMALHHLCDWAIFINRFGLVLPDELTNKRFLRAVNAMTSLCNHYLGTSINRMNRYKGSEIKVVEGEAFADEMLDEILHPEFPYKEKVAITGKWDILVYKTRRFLHAARVKNRIIYTPLWKRIWVSVVAHVCNPGTIFKMHAD